MLTYDFILEGHNVPEIYNQENEQALIDVINGMVWPEIEQTENTISNKRHIVDHAGISAWYDFGADYYFFTDDEG